MIIDGTGTLANVKRHDYLPFGEELFAPAGGRTTALGYASSDGIRQQFTQKERDVETGLDYFGARYYASVQGRFTSVDPYDINLERQSITDLREAKATFNRYLSNPQHWNRFSYVLNNPLKYIDPDGLAERLVVQVNIVYDRDQFTEEEARKAAAAQVADLKKVYGPLDIDFEVQYTAGSANAEKTTISEGAKDGAVNVFLSKNNTNHNVGVTRANGQIFLILGANQGMNPIGTGVLSHEMGHKFGISWETGIRIGGVDYVADFYNDFHIDTSNAKLRRGGAREGVNWVDDYRKVPPQESIAIIRGGAYYRKRPYRPTTFDIYRVGARKLAGK